MELFVNFGNRFVLTWNHELLVVLVVFISHCGSSLV